MADSQDNQNPSEEDVQKQFWEEMDKRFTDKLKPITDALSNLIKPSDPKTEPANPPAPEPGKKDDKPPQGTSRTGGPRVTLSSLIADAVFGPKKD